MSLLNCRWNLANKLVSPYAFQGSPRLYWRILLKLNSYDLHTNYFSYKLHCGSSLREVSWTIAALKYVKSTESVVSYMLATLLKKRHWHRCFPVNPGDYFCEFVKNVCEEDPFKQSCDLATCKPAVTSELLYRHISKPLLTYIMNSSRLPLPNLTYKFLLLLHSCSKFLVQ